jgi:hypothetical protein
MLWMAYYGRQPLVYLKLPENIGSIPNYACFLPHTSPGAFPFPLFSFTTFPLEGVDLDSRAGINCKTEIQGSLPNRTTLTFI